MSEVAQIIALLKYSIIPPASEAKSLKKVASSMSDILKELLKLKNTATHIKNSNVILLQKKDIKVVAWDVQLDTEEGEVDADYVQEVEGLI